MCFVCVYVCVCVCLFLILFCYRFRFTAFPIFPNACAHNLKFKCPKQLLVSYCSENPSISLNMTISISENKTGAMHSGQRLTSSFADDVLSYFPLPKGQGILKINIWKTAGSRFNIVIPQSSLLLF